MFPLEQKKIHSSCWTSNLDIVCEQSEPCVVMRKNMYIFFFTKCDHLNQKQLQKFENKLMNIIRKKKEIWKYIVGEKFVFEFSIYASKF